MLILKTSKIYFIIKYNKINCKGDFMNISAIISEYNPFHNGHKFHIEETRKITGCDGIVIVLSGNFVQRGIPALINKFKRTKLILENGADLIIELPAIYALSSAEFFAKGAVSLLDQLNSIDYLSFGSEEGTLEILNLVSDILVNEPELYKNQLKKSLNQGLSFPKARESALSSYLLNVLSYENFLIENVISKSNNILSIEYLKSLKIYNSNIQAATVKRQGENYNSLNFDKKFCSASAIRNYLLKEDEFDLIENFVPENVYNSLRHEINNFSSPNDIFPYIKYKAAVEKIPISLPDANDGLDNRILNKIITNHSYENLLNNLQTKRYTNTRLMRILTQYFIGFEKYDIENLRKTPCPYARILGFNSKGKEILKILKKNSNIPLITKFPQKNLSPHLLLDLNSTAAYSIINNSTHFNDDYLISPIILD